MKDVRFNDILLISEDINHWIRTEQTRHPRHGTSPGGMRMRMGKGIERGRRGGEVEEQQKRQREKKTFHACMNTKEGGCREREREREREMDGRKEAKGAFG